MDINKSLIDAVRLGRLGRVKYLITSYGLSYSKTWCDGYVLLRTSIINKRTAVTKLLLTSGCKVNSKKRILLNTPLHLAVQNDDIKIVKMLIDRGAYINIKDRNGSTPLHHAISKKVTELLLKNGAIINATRNDGKTFLHIATEKNCFQIVELLLKHGAYVNYACTSTKREGYTPLHIATEIGSEEIMKLLLMRGANVNARGIDGITSLHIAVAKYDKGRLEIIELLLKHGAYVNYACTLTRREGYTPLHIAAEDGNTEVVKLLLISNAHINASTKANLTPIYLATESGHTNVVKILLDLGANVDTQDNDGKTILHLAVEKGYLAIIEHILKHCPDVNNPNNRISLNVAVYGSGKDYSKIVESLLQYGFSVDPGDINNCKLLYAAIEKGYLKIVEPLLKYGTNVNMLYTSGSKRGCTPLHEATKNKQEKVATLLINYGADVNVKDGYMKTPICYTIENSDYEMFKLLLTKGADIKDNLELLTTAVKEECREIVETLLQHNADINASDKYGRTALHFTVLHENGLYPTNEDPDNNNKGEIAKLLLSMGANVDAEDMDGTTALHAATKQGYIELVETLLEYNANVNCSDKEGMTPLHISALVENKVISTMLLNKGANVNAKQIEGVTGLHEATTGGHKEVVEVLLTYGGKVDYTVEGGFTPLHIAASKGNLEIAYILLKFGADIDSDDDSSALTGNIEISTMLLKKGANVNDEHKNGSTALHMATRNGHKGVVEVLLKYGAKVDCIIWKMYNCVLKEWMTPLQIAAYKDYLEIVKALLKFGADIDFRDGHGRTALHIASEEGNASIVLALLEHGSDINILNEYNCTPLHVAMDGIQSFFNKASYYDSDDEYNYDYCRGICSEIVANFLKKEIIKMKTANLYVNISNLLWISDDSEQSEFLYDCQEEMECMKIENIGNTNVSYHDILTKNINQLATYTRNENIIQGLKSDVCKWMFPLYAGIINNRFRKGVERKELLEQANKLAHFLFNRFPQLPYNCTEEIFSYLNDKDLKILINVCDDISIRNTDSSDIEGI